MSDLVAVVAAPFQFHLPPPSAKLATIAGFTSPPRASSASLAKVGHGTSVGVGRRRSPRVAAPVPQAHKLPSTRPPTSHHRQAPSTPLSMSPRTAGDLSFTTVRAGAGEEMEAPTEMYHRMLKRKSRREWHGSNFAKFQGHAPNITNRDGIFSNLQICNGNWNGCI